jgi:hypothetical protein
MKTATNLMLATAVLVTMIAMAAPLVAPGGQPCMGCHSGDKPSSDFRFAMPAMRLSYPSAAPPGQLIRVTMVLDHAGRYAVDDATATLELSGPGIIEPNRPSTTTLPTITASGGSSTVQWSVLTGNQTGTLSLSARLSFTAARRHTNDDSHDSSRFTMFRTGALSVRPMSLFVGAGEVVFGGSQPARTIIDLKAIADSKNITLAPSGNVAGAIRVFPSFTAHLPPGQVLQVEVEALNGSAGGVNGRIELTWENATGSPDAAFIAISSDKPVAPVPAVGSGALRFTGRVTGLLSLAILISAIVLGRVRLKARTRLRVHCTLAWFIVGLSVYHGLMLVFGPYAKHIWQTPVVLGYISAAVMATAGITGLARARMSKKVGYKAWKWTHRIALISATVLVIVHALLMGTDLAFIRAAFNGT